MGIKRKIGKREMEGRERRKGEGNYKEAKEGRKGD